VVVFWLLSFCCCCRRVVIVVVKHPYQYSYLLLVPKTGLCVLVLSSIEYWSNNR
jgi:hypothetical protein